MLKLLLNYKRLLFGRIKTKQKPFLRMAEEKQDRTRGVIDESSGIQQSEKK